MQLLTGRTGREVGGDQRENWRNPQLVETVTLRAYCTESDFIGHQPAISDESTLYRNVSSSCSCVCGVKTLHEGSRCVVQQNVSMHVLFQSRILSSVRIARL